VPIGCSSGDALIRHERATGRAKDLGDIEGLEPGSD
jgi:hypothetical protein